MLGAVPQRTPRRATVSRRLPRGDEQVDDNQKWKPNGGGAIETGDSRRRTDGRADAAKGAHVSPIDQFATPEWSGICTRIAHIAPHVPANSNLA